MAQPTTVMALLAVAFASPAPAARTSVQHPTEAFPAAIVGVEDQVALGDGREFVNWLLSLHSEIVVQASQQAFAALKN